MANVETRPRLRETIASEIRIAMLRRGVTGAQLADAMGKSPAYVSRRLSGGTAFDVDDLEVIAATLNVRAADLIGHAERGDGAYVAGADPNDRSGGYTTLADLDLANPPIVNDLAALGPTIKAWQRATAVAVSDGAERAA